MNRWTAAQGPPMPRCWNSPPTSYIYVPEAKLDEALQQYREYRQNRGKVAQADDVDTAFVLLLMRAGKFAEMEKVAAKHSIRQRCGVPCCWPRLPPSTGRPRPNRRPVPWTRRPTSRRALAPNCGDLLGRRAGLTQRPKELYQVAGQSDDEAAQVKADGPGFSKRSAASKRSS